MHKITMGVFEYSEEDIEYVTKAIKSNMLSTGEELLEFEKKVASYHGYKNGIMVNSGQSALEVALELAKYKLKKENLKVIVPTTTYAATLWAVIRSGCIPVFVDINLRDLNIDLAQILLDKDLLKCDVLLTVDLCGKAVEMTQDIKDKFFIISDSCEAFGNRECNYADIACFSFYVSHIITTGSGGMVCTDDDNLCDYAKSYISHGRKHGGDFTNYKDEWVDRFYFDKIGCSYRSDNLSASLGLSQLNKLEEIIDKRKRNANTMLTLISNRLDNSIINNFKFPPFTKNYIKNSVFQFFPILISNHDINREHLLKYLFKNNIDSRVLLSLTNQPIFEKKFGIKEKYKYPNSHYCNDFGFIVGCHQKLSGKEMKYIADTLENYIKENVK